MLLLNNLTIYGLTSTDLFLLVMLLAGVILILHLTFNWYVRKITPTKPNQALIIQALQRPLIITLILVSLSLFVYLAITPSGSLFYQIISTVILVSWTASSLVIAKGLIRLATQNLTRRYQHASDATPMLTSFAVTIILFTALYAFFLIWHINATPLFAALSIIGAALSFAARDAVGNTISGISIFITQPFKVGDYIVVDADFQGVIQEIGVQQTKLLSPSRTLLIIPNSTIITRPVENQTALKPYVKFSLPLTLPLNTDIDSLKSTLLKHAGDNKWLLPSPQPKIRYLNLTKDSLELEFTAALKDPAKGALVTHQLLQTLTKLLPPTPLPKTPS